LIRIIEFLEKDLFKMIEKVIIIGGSAGSLTPVLSIIEECPLDFKHPIVIVLHRGKNQQNILLELLTRRSKRSVLEVNHYDQLECSKVYIAPSNYHLLIGYDYHMELDYSEKIMYSRPSIDVSFKSFAKVFKKNLIAVVLSGANKDSAVGAGEILSQGGTVIVQDPNDAEVSTMPQETLIANPDIKHIVPFNQIMKTILNIT